MVNKIFIIVNLKAW